MSDLPTSPKGTATTGKQKARTSDALSEFQVTTSDSLPRALANPLTRRRFLQGSTFAGTAAFLAACSGTQATPGPTGAASASPFASSLATPIVREPVTLTYWTWAHITAVPGFEDDPIKQAFEAANPDVTLEVRIFPYPDYLTALRTGVPGGTSGHVLGMQAGAMGLQYRQFLKPLNAIADSTFGASWQDSYAQKLIDITLANNDFPNGKELYGLPLGAGILGVNWYWQNLFESTGVEVPQDYAQLKEAAVAFRGAGLVPMAWGAQDQWPNTDFLVAFASQFQQGAVEKAELGEIKFTDAPVVNALAFMAQTLEDGIYNEGPFGTTTYPQADDLFFSEQAAMYNTGIHSALAVRNHPGSEENVRAFLFPHIPNAPQQDWLGGIPSGSPTATGPSPSRAVTDPSVVLSMRGDLEPAVDDAAWRFLAFMFGEEAQRINLVWNPPSFKGIAQEDFEDQGFLDMLNWHSEIAAVAERREFLFPETRAAIQTAIESVCVNGADAATELARVDEAAGEAREKALAAG